MQAQLINILGIVQDPIADCICLLIELARSPVMATEVASFCTRSVKILKELLGNCLASMESGRFPEHCKDLVLPLLRKATSVLKQGDPDKCKVMYETLAARWIQLADEIFNHVGSLNQDDDGPNEGDE